MSRRFPALKSIAAVTVLTFTITTLLPAGWTWAAPAHETMRVRQAEPEGEPSPVAVGLEAALQDRPVPPTSPPAGLEESGSLSRRNFFQRVGVGAAAVAVGAAVNVSAQPIPPSPAALPPVVAPAAPVVAGQVNHATMNGRTGDVQLSPKLYDVETAVKPREQSVWDGITDQFKEFQQGVRHQFGWDALPPPVSQWPAVSAVRRGARAWAPTVDDAHRANRTVLRSYIEWAPWTVTLDRWQRVFEAMQAMAVGQGSPASARGRHSRIYLGAYGILTHEDKEWRDRKQLANLYGIEVVPLLGDPLMALDPTVAEQQALELFAVTGVPPAFDIEPKELKGYDDPDLTRRAANRRAVWQNILNVAGNVRQKQPRFAQTLEDGTQRLGAAISLFVPPDFDVLVEEYDLQVPAGVNLVYMPYKTTPDHNQGDVEGLPTNDAAATRAAADHILKRLHYDRTQRRTRIGERTHATFSMAVDFGAPPQGGEYPWWERMGLLPGVTQALYQDLAADPSFSGEIILHPRSFEILLGFLKDGELNAEQRALYEAWLDGLRIKNGLQQAADFVLLGRTQELPRPYGHLEEETPEQTMRAALVDLFRRLASGATGGGSMYAHWATVFRTIRNSMAIGKYQLAYDANMALLDPAYGMYYNVGLLSYSRQFGRDAKIQAAGPTPAVQLIATEPEHTRDGQPNPRRGQTVLVSGDLVGADDLLYGLPDNGYDLEIRITVANPSAERFTGNILGYIYTGHGLPAMVESEKFVLEPGAHTTVSLKGNGLRAWRYHRGSMLRVALGLVNGTRGRAGEFSDMVGAPGYNMDLVSALLSPPTNALPEDVQAAGQRRDALQRRVAQTSWTRLMPESLDRELGMTAAFGVGDDPTTWIQDRLAAAAANGVTTLMVSSAELLALARSYQTALGDELPRGRAVEITDRLNAMETQPEVQQWLARLYQLSEAAHRQGLRVVWTVEEAEAGRDPTGFFRVLSLLFEVKAAALGQVSDGLAWRLAPGPVTAPAAPRAAAIREIAQMFGNAQFRFLLLSQDPQEADRLGLPTSLQTSLHACEMPTGATTDEMLQQLPALRQWSGLVVVSQAQAQAFQQPRQRVDPQEMTQRMTAAATPAWLTATTGQPGRFLSAGRRMVLDHVGVRKTATLATGLISPVAPLVYPAGTTFQHYTLVYRVKDLNGPGLWVSELPVVPGQLDLQSSVTLEAQEMAPGRVYAASAELMPSALEQRAAGVPSGLAFVAVPGQRPVILNPGMTVSVPVAGTTLVFGHTADGQRTIALTAAPGQPQPSLQLTRRWPYPVAVRVSSDPPGQAPRPLEPGQSVSVTLAGRLVTLTRDLTGGGVAIRVGTASPVTLWEIEDQQADALRTDPLVSLTGPVPISTHYDLTRRAAPVPTAPAATTARSPVAETMRPPPAVGGWLGRQIAKVVVAGGALVALTRTVGRIRAEAEASRLVRAQQAQLRAAGQSRPPQSVSGWTRTLRIVGAALLVGTAVALVAGAFPAIAAAVPALGFLKLLAVPSWLTTLVLSPTAWSWWAILLKLTFSAPLLARLLLATWEVINPDFQDTAPPFWAWTLPKLSAAAIPIMVLTAIGLLSWGAGAAVGAAVMGFLKAAVFLWPPAVLIGLGATLCIGLVVYGLSVLHRANTAAREARQQGRDWPQAMAAWAQPFRLPLVLVSASVGLGTVFGFGVPTLAGLTLLKLFQGIALVLVTAGTGQFFAGAVARRAPGWRGLHPVVVGSAALVVGVGAWAFFSVAAAITTLPLIWVLVKIAAVVLGTVGVSMGVGLIPNATEPRLRQAGSVIAPVAVALGAKALWDVVAVSKGVVAGIGLFGTFVGLLVGAGVVAVAASVAIRWLYAHRWVVVRPFANSGYQLAEQLLDLRQPRMTRWVSWRTESLARNAVDARSADAQAVLTPTALHALGLRYPSLDHLIAQTTPDHPDRLTAIQAMQGWYVEHDLVDAIHAADPVIIPLPRQTDLVAAARGAVAGHPHDARLARNEWREIERQMVPIQGARDTDHHVTANRTAYGLPGPAPVAGTNPNLTEFIEVRTNEVRAALTAGVVTGNAAAAITAVAAAIPAGQTDQSAVNQALADANQAIAGANAASTLEEIARHLAALTAAVRAAREIAEERGSSPQAAAAHAAENAVDVLARRTATPVELLNGFMRERTRADMVVQLDYGAQIAGGSVAWALGGMIQRLREDDQIHGVFPSIFVVPNWDYNFFYFGVGLLAQSFLQISQALQYIISMGKRAGRSRGPDSNALNPLTGFIRSDMENRLWGFLMEVQGRWLVGHVYVMMEAFRGQTFHWDPNALRPARYERSYDGLFQVINSLMGRSDYLSRAAAYYAAFPESRNLWYGTGERPPFSHINLRQWNDDLPREGGPGAGILDEAGFSLDFGRGEPGVWGIRLLRRQEVLLYTPFSVTVDAQGQVVAGRVPAKFAVRFGEDDQFPVVESPTKAYRMGVALSILQKLYTTQPVVTGAGTVVWAAVFPDRNHVPEYEAGRAVMAERRLQGHDLGARQHYDAVVTHTIIAGIEETAGYRLVPPPLAIRSVPRAGPGAPALSRNGPDDILYELGYDGYRGHYGRILQGLYRVVDVLTLKRWERRRSNGPTAVFHGHGFWRCVDFAIGWILSREVMDAGASTNHQLLPTIASWFEGTWQAVTRVFIPGDQGTTIQRLTTRRAILEERGLEAGNRLARGWPTSRRITLGRLLYHMALPFWTGIGIIAAVSLGWLALTSWTFWGAAALIGMSRFVLEPLIKDVIPIAYWKFRQAAIAMGLKAHYDPIVAFNMVTLATGRRVGGLPPHMTHADYRNLLEQGNARLHGVLGVYLLVEQLSRALAGEHYAEDPNRSPRAWIADLSAEIEERLLDQGRAAGWGDPDWLAVQHAMLRLIQGEHMAVGNRIVWHAYHGSRDPKVMRGGDVNFQFSVAEGENQHSLEFRIIARIIARLLGVPFISRRSWAFYSPGASVGGVRIPSQMFVDAGDRLINGEDVAAFAASPLNRLVHGALVDLEHVVWRDGRLILVSPGLAAFSASDRMTTLRETFGLAGITPADFGVAGFADITVVAIYTPASGDHVLAHRINALEAYLHHAGLAESVNHFFLEHSWLEPDTEAVERTLAQRTADEIELAGLADRVHPETADSGLIPDADNPHRITWLDAIVYHASHWLDTHGRVGYWVSRIVGTGVGTGIVYGGVELVLVAAVATSPPIIVGGVIVGVAVAAAGLIATGSTWLTLRKDAQVHELPLGDGVRSLSLIPGLLLKWPLWLAWFKGIVPFLWNVIGYPRNWQTRNALREQGREWLFEVPHSADFVTVGRWLAQQRGITDPVAQRQFLQRFIGLHHDMDYPLLAGTAFFPGMPILRPQVGTRSGTKVQGSPVTLATLRRLSYEPAWTAPLSGFNYLPSVAWDIGKAFAEDTLFGWIMAYSDSLYPKTPAVSIQELNYLFSRYEELRDDSAGPQRAMAFYKGMGMAVANQELADVVARAGDLPLDQLVAEVAGLIQYMDGMRFAARDEVATGGGLGAGMYSYLFTSFTGTQLFAERVGPYEPGAVEALLQYLVFQRIDQLYGGALARQLHAMNAAYPDNPLHGTTFPQGRTLADQAVRQQLLGTNWQNIQAPKAGGWFTDPRIALAAVKAQIHDAMVRLAIGEETLVELARRADAQMRAESRPQYRDTVFEDTDYYRIMRQALAGFQPVVQMPDGRSLTETREVTDHLNRVISGMDLANLSWGGRYDLRPTDQFRQLRVVNDRLRQYGKTRIIVANAQAVTNLARMVTAHPLGTAAPAPSTPIAPPAGLGSAVVTPPAPLRPALVAPVTVTAAAAAVTTTQAVGQEEPPTLPPGIILMDAAARAVPVLTAHGIATVGVATSPVQAETLIAAGLEDNQLVVAGAAPGQFRWAAGSLDEALAVARARLKLQTAGPIQVVTEYQFSATIDSILRRAGVGLEELKHLLDEARTALYA